MNNKKKSERQKRSKELIKVLNREFANAKLALRYKTVWQLTVAVQLSAQCTDKKVNEVTEKLFKKYKSVNDFANAKQNELEKDIYQTGYYRNKAKNLISASNMILEKHKGKVPKTMNELLKVPGVARKTANVILGNAYGVVDGIVVDTHMIRFAKRFDLTDHNKDAVKIERDLMEVIPKEEWFPFAYKVVEYGRSYGNPRGKRELHEKDPLLKIYKKAKNFWP